MAERDAKIRILDWRWLVISAAGIVGACALALLLIEQLSLRATIQGGLMAFAAMVFSRLAVRWWSTRQE